MCIDEATNFAGTPGQTPYHTHITAAVTCQEHHPAFSTRDAVT